MNMLSLPGRSAPRDGVAGLEGGRGAHSPVSARRRPRCATQHSRAESNCSAARQRAGKAAQQRHKGHKQVRGLQRPGGIAAHPGGDELASLGLEGGQSTAAAKAAAQIRGTLAAVRLAIAMCYEAFRESVRRGTSSDEPGRLRAWHLAAPGKRYACPLAASIALQRHHIQAVCFL